MAEFASNAKGNAALVTGITGTVLSAMNVLNNGGVLGNRSGGGCCPTEESAPVSRYELGLENENAKLRSEIALRDANIYNDQKLLEVYKYFDNKIEGINAKLCDQAVYNATQTAAMNCMGGQIAQLFSLTKLVVPNTSVCPGWGNVTVTPAAAPAAGA